MELVEFWPLIIVILCMAAAFLGYWLNSGRDTDTDLLAILPSIAFFIALILVVRNYRGN